MKKAIDWEAAFFLGHSINFRIQSFRVGQFISRSLAEFSPQMGVKSKGIPPKMALIQGKDLE